MTHIKWQKLILPTQIRGYNKNCLLSENRRSPYWNSTFSFHFELCVIITMSFCLSCLLPNFTVIGQ